MRGFAYLFLLSIIFLTSCKGTGEVSAGSEAARGTYEFERNFVDTVHLKYTDFSREILNNGILNAVRMAKLTFKTQGDVAKVFVQNGDYVKKGDTLAVLDTRALELKLKNASQDMLKAEIDYRDRLIGFGYSIDSDDIPEEVEKIATIHSGYSTAKNNLESARLELSNAALIAPFDGIVANMGLKPYEATSENSCTVIDNTSFDVTFNLLESELDYVKKGERITVTPFIRESENYYGSIKSINPFVDENGQISVTASIRNSDRKLVEGMNVKVFIKNISHNRLTVPKSAVVIRDGLDVIFTVDTVNMRAKWVYVDILESNSTHHVIKGNAERNSELNGGEIVITSGNLNLAEGSNVEFKL